MKKKRIIIKYKKIKNMNLNFNNMLMISIMLIKNNHLCQF